MSVEITSVTMKFYHGCIFHNGREIYGRFRRKGDLIWEDLCKECFIKANCSPSFRAAYELERATEKVTTTPWA